MASYHGSISRPLTDANLPDTMTDTEFRNACWKTTNVVKVIVFIHSSDDRTKLEKYINRLDVNVHSEEIEWEERSDGHKMVRVPVAYLLAGKSENVRDVLIRKFVRGWIFYKPTRVCHSAGSTANDNIGANGKRAIAFTKMNRAERMAIQDTQAIKEMKACDQERLERQQMERRKQILTSLGMKWKETSDEDKKNQFRALTEELKLWTLVRYEFERMEKHNKDYPNVPFERPWLETLKEFLKEKNERQSEPRRMEWRELMKLPLCSAAAEWAEANGCTINDVTHRFEREGVTLTLAQMCEIFCKVHGIEQE